MYDMPPRGGGDNRQRTRCGPGFAARWLSSVITRMLVRQVSGKKARPYARTWITWCCAASASSSTTSTYERHPQTRTDLDSERLLVGVEFHHPQARPTDTLIYRAAGPQALAPPQKREEAPPKIPPDRSPIPSRPQNLRMRPPSRLLRAAAKTTVATNRAHPSPLNASVPGLLR